MRGNRCIDGPASLNFVLSKQVSKSGVLYPSLESQKCDNSIECCNDDVGRVQILRRCNDQSHGSAGASLNEASSERQKFHLRNFLKTFLVVTVSPTPISGPISRHLQQLHLYWPLCLALTGWPVLYTLTPKTFTANGALSIPLALAGFVLSKAAMGLSYSCSYWYWYFIKNHATNVHGYS